jgi:hypothetical protein
LVFGCWLILKIKHQRLVELISMSLHKLKQQARQLYVDERWELINDLIESLQASPSPHPERTSIIKQMKGLLKTDQPAPTDQEVAAMLEERRVEKYL